MVELWPAFVCRSSGCPSTFYLNFISYENNSFGSDQFLQEWG